MHGTSCLSFCYQLLLDLTEGRQRSGHSRRPGWSELSAGRAGVDGDAPDAAGVIFYFFGQLGRAANSSRQKSTMSYGSFAYSP